MQSYYEINVSLDGKHFFATAPRSCVDRQQALAVTQLFHTKFPEAQGFKVDVTYWKCEGNKVDF